MPRSKQHRDVARLPDGADGVARGAWRRGRDASATGRPDLDHLLLRLRKHASEIHDELAEHLSASGDAEAAAETVRRLMFIRKVWNPK